MTTSRNTAQPEEGSFAEGSGQRPRNLVFGWSAPSFAEQLPNLPPADAAAFDDDNRAIIRLSVRGFLTAAERDRSIARVTKEVRAKLASVASPHGDGL